MCTTYYNIYLSVIGRLNRTVVCFNYTTCLHELSRHHYMYKLLYLMLWNIVRCLPFQDAKSVSDVAVKLRFLILRKYFIPQFNPFAIKLWMAKSLSLFHIIYICLKKKQDLKICKICLSRFMRIWIPCIQLGIYITFIHCVYMFHQNWFLVHYDDLTISFIVLCVSSLLCMPLLFLRQHVRMTSCVAMMGHV